MARPDRPPGDAEGGPPIEKTRLHITSTPSPPGAEVVPILSRGTGSGRDVPDLAPCCILAVRELLTATPDPAVVDEHWQRICRQMVADARPAAYRAGYRRGYVDGIECRKRAEHDLVDALGELAETERRRWHLCCPACRRRGGCRAGCRDCQDRTLETFAEPRPGDYTGRQHG